MIPMPTPNNQFRLPLPETNPNFCKNDNVEKRKTAMPKRKFRPATLRIAVMCLPLPQAPPKPSNNTTINSNNIPTTIREDTPWPGTGKMSGNLFDDRNWLLPKGYLAIEDKKGDTTTPSLKEEPKTKEHSTSPKEEKCSWGPDCPFCKVQDKEGEDPQQRPSPKLQGQKPASMTKTKQQWEAKMERLNTKYNLDCFSDLEQILNQTRMNNTSMNIGTRH